MIVQQGTPGNCLYVLAGESTVSAQPPGRPACGVPSWLTPPVPRSHLDPAAGRASVHVKATEEKKTAVSHIEAGEVFGELALLYNCMRTATVKGSASGSCLPRCVHRCCKPDGWTVNAQALYPSPSSLHSLRQPRSRARYGASIGMRSSTWPSAPSRRSKSGSWRSSPAWRSLRGSTATFWRSLLLWHTRCVTAAARRARKRGPGLL